MQGRRTTPRRRCDSGANGFSLASLSGYRVKPNTSLVALVDGRLAAFPEAFQPFGRIETTSPLCSERQRPRQRAAERTGRGGLAYLSSAEAGPAWSHATEHGNGQQDGCWRTRPGRAAANMAHSGSDRIRQRQISRAVGCWDDFAGVAAAAAAGSGPPWRVEGDPAQSASTSHLPPLRVREGWAWGRAGASRLATCDRSGGPPAGAHLSLLYRSSTADGAHPRRR